MSRWFLVPVTVYVEVKVRESDDLEFDRREALETAETLARKRLKECEWGQGNPWSASVRSYEMGEAEYEPDEEERDDEEED